MINLLKMTKNKFSNIVFFLPKNELVWGVDIAKNFFVKLKVQSINQSINQSIKNFLASLAIVKNFFTLNFYFKHRFNPLVHKHERVFYCPMEIKLILELGR
jgi:hypothetical protein